MKTCEITAIFSHGKIQQQKTNEKTRRHGGSFSFTLNLYLMKKLLPKNAVQNYSQFRYPLSFFMLKKHKMKILIFYPLRISEISAVTSAMFTSRSSFTSARCRMALSVTPLRMMLIR